MSLVALGRTRLNDLLGGSDVLRRLASLSGWTLASFAIEKAASIVVILALARVLGAEDFGRVVLAQGLVTTLQIVVVLGAGPVFTRYVPVLRRTSFDRATELISLCFAIAGLMSLVLIGVMLTLGRPWVSSLLDLEGPVLPGVIAAWSVLAAGAYLAATVATSFERGRSLGLVAAVGAVATVAVVPLAALRYGLIGALTALAIVEAFKLAWLVGSQAAFARKEGGSLWRRPRMSDLRLIGDFGVPVFLTSALWGPTMWLGQVIISQRAPEGLVAVGVFGFANSALGAVILLSTLTNRAAMPILASLHADGRHGDLRRLSGRMALIQLAVSAAIAVPICLGAPWIMALAGPAFGAQWPVLVLMILTGVVIAGQTALGNYLLVTERQVFLLGTMVIWAVLVLAGALAFATAGAYALSGALLVAALVRTAVIGAGYAMQDGPARSMNSPIRGS